MALRFSASSTGLNNPDTLYDQCVRSIVVNANFSVPSLERIYQLRFLPQGLLIDVYEVMSRRECLKDVLLEQIGELEIFDRLLRFPVARAKLHRVLSELMSSKKPLANLLQKQYVMKYQLPAVTLRDREQLHSASKLSKLAKEKLEQTLVVSKNDIGDNLHAENSIRVNVSVFDEAADAAADTLNSVIDTIDIVDNEDDINGTEFPFTNIRTTVGVKNGVAGILASIVPPTQENALTGVYSAQKRIDMNDNNANEKDILLRDPNSNIDPICLGMRLGSFLIEAGWMADSIAVLNCLDKRLMRLTQTPENMMIRVDCLQRLIIAQSSHCDFKGARTTLHEINVLLEKIDTNNVPSALLASTYTSISAMYFARNDYDNSHMWSVLAMRNLEPRVPERIIIDTLRQAAKSCVVKRDFSRANLLIGQAVRRARIHFGPRHQKYGDALLDYGFFLINVDSIYQAVVIYKEALEVRREIFGNRNYHVAIAHEDLSYACYVNEYSTGDFSCAQDHVDKAVDIMKDLVPSNHLMLASAKRVKALLLEEIALDKMAGGMNEEGLLNQSEELHKFALQLSLQVFGEVNVQTAKHYGNLGRLYQTMNRFEEAERMHKKAIKIKTDLLGPNDYEVGLSVGHLASLYNYQMKKYREAEDLYLRSIDISTRLFGHAYSGLEYDYLGLCHVYETLREFEKYLRYANILENWQVLRGQNLTRNSNYPVIDELFDLQQVKNKFFNLNSSKLPAGASANAAK